MGKFKITQSPASKNIFLYPENNGCVNECFSSGDNPNWKCVDDLQDALEPETTHVWMDDVSIVSELYSMGNHTIETGTINYVKAYDKAKSDKYAPHVDATYKVMIAKGLVDAYPVLTLRPNADGAFSQWIPLLGGGHYTNVDEAVCDNATSTIREGTNGDKDYFILPNHTIETGTITQVEVFACCGNGDAGIKLVIYDTSSTNRQTFSVSWLVGDGWNMQSHIFATNPDGGAWTWGDIDDLQIGVEKESGAFPYVSQLYVEITYEEGTTCSEFSLSDNMPLCTGYGLFGFAWMDSPWTDTDWTWDEVDDLLAGFECSSPSVIMTPFALLPIADGDRTDITNVTTGYEHWKAVEKEKPYAEVFEPGAAWKYDLYKFIEPKIDGTTYSSNTRGSLLHNGYMFSCNIGDGLYVHKFIDDKYFEYVDWRLDGDWTSLPQEIETDGTYYYVTSAGLMLVYTFDAVTEKLTLVCEDYSINNTIYEKYYNGYLYVGDGNILRVLTFDGTSFTEVDNYAVNGNVIGILHDGNYLYVTSANGFIYAFSFDGSSLTFIDSDNPVGVDMGQIATDGDYIYCTVQMDSIYAYSFDGTTLTYITKLEAGVSHNSVLCYNDHVLTCRNGVGTYDLNAYKFNGAIFSPVLATYHIGVPGARSSWTMRIQGGYINIVWGAPISVAFNGDGTELREVAAVEDDNTPKYINDNIESVTIVAKMGKDPSAADGADIRGCFNIKTGGSEFNTSTDYFTLETKQRYYVHTWTENPDTVAAWTLAEVQALQAGIGLYGTGSKYATCSRCYIIIGTVTNISPEIKTCQTYLKVNYTPEDTVCWMPKPQEISTNHARNVKTLNFWNGEREVYDVNRSGKSMVLTGGITDGNPDVIDVCFQIICVRDMTRDGTIITISGLNPVYFNGEYRINSFGWNKIGEKPENYEWILELESAY